MAETGQKYEDRGVLMDGQQNRVGSSDPQSRVHRDQLFQRYMW